MRRGDVVTVAAPGDFGKPRPALIVQSDAFPESHVSVIACQMTSRVVDDLDFRVTIEPSMANGLRVRSQIMVDKPITVLRRRIGNPVDHLADDDMARVNIALALVMGLTD